MAAVGAGSCGPGQEITHDPPEPRRSGGRGVAAGPECTPRRSERRADRQHAQAHSCCRLPEGSDPRTVLARDLAKLSHGREGHHRIENYDSTSRSKRGHGYGTAVGPGSGGLRLPACPDWAPFGVPGFRPLMSHFAGTNGRRPARRVAASPVAAAVQASLSNYGAVGVGLVAGERGRSCRSAAGHTGSVRRAEDPHRGQTEAGRWSPRWVPAGPEGLASNECDLDDAGGISPARPTTSPLLHSGDTHTRT